jgi:hypothetical protein
MPKLYNWSAAGGARASFGVTAVSNTGITVQPLSGQPRFVPREDFASLFPLWTGYRNGEIQRGKLNFCFNSSYVVSIFHWMELQP